MGPLEDITRREVLVTGGRILGGALLGTLLGQFSFLSEANAMPTPTNHFSPRNDKRALRPHTDYIILHTTEGPGRGSLERITRRGLANFMLDTDGTVYRTISENRIAKHAGRSMWNNLRNIDNYGIGIEVVGYHNQDLTSSQYKSLADLLNKLKQKYDIADDNVLTHSMVVYGAPNEWHPNNHRGRKRCGMLMGTTTVRKKLGLHSKPSYDPDVRAGRLVVADDYLEKVLYGGTPIAIAEPPKQEEPETDDKSDFEGFRESKKGETAVTIAQNAYDDSTTIYFLPIGTVRTGEEMRYGVLTSIRGRSVRNVEFPQFPNIPEKTKVLVGYTYGGHVHNDRTAWSICGKEWNYPSTFYRLPNGVIKSGDELDEANLPDKTLVLFRK